MSARIARHHASVLAVAAMALAAAGTAQAAPTISGADGDVWNASAPTPTYTITASNPRLRVFWSVQGGPSGSGASPLVVRLPRIADGSYTLTGTEILFPQASSTTRAFRVDVTPPAVRIATPQTGSAFDQGAAVLADYACTGAVSCAGPVAAGAPLDTAAPGDKAFRVTATDDAGNIATADAPYTVRGVGSPPATASGAVTPAPPTVVKTTPRTVNARRLRPAPGAVAKTLRPVLSWPELDRARFYNLQIFRLQGGAAKKVVSVFPHGSHYRLPPHRLVRGARYAWRLWPYLADGYSRRPLGISFFAVRSAPAR